MTVVSQINYYVSSTGDNNNIGTSTNLVWQTIQHAMNNAVPNSIVNIIAGTYNEKVEVNVSGTVGSIEIENKLCFVESA